MDACPVQMIHSSQAQFLGCMTLSVCYPGFTTPEEVEEVDTSQEQPQGLAAFVSKLQGFSQNDPFYAVLAYKDFKPSAV